LDGRLFLDIAEKIYTDEEMAAMNRVPDEDGSAEEEAGIGDEGNEGNE
jgi:hypothetical protein